MLMVTATRTYIMGLMIAAALIFGITALEVESFPEHTPERVPAEMDAHQVFHDRLVSAKRMMDERQLFHDHVVAAQSRNAKKRKVMNAKCSADGCTEEERLALQDAKLSSELLAEKVDRANALLTGATADHIKAAVCL